MEELNTKRKKEKINPEAHTSISMPKVGRQLKKLRITEGYSQEYLAHELGMTQGNYCKLESDYHFPSSETLEKITSLYSIPIHNLFSSNDELKNTDDEIDKVQAFISLLDSQKIFEELLNAKEIIISLQAKQIELLEWKLREKKQ